MNHLQEPPCILLIKATSPGLTFKIVMYLILEIDRKTFLEKAMATQSTALAWKIPMMEEPGGLKFMGHEQLDTTEKLHFHFSVLCIGEGNGNQLQCFCLENLRDGGAWWAAIHRIAQSRTRLKRFSHSSSRKTFTLEFSFFAIVLAYLTLNRKIKSFR